ALPAARGKGEGGRRRAPGLPQYSRGLALAALPQEAGKAGQAVADLEFVLAVRDQFPAAMIRAAHRGLAAAHTTLGNTGQAEQAAAAAGLDGVPADVRLEFSSSWVNPADGFHFTSPPIAEPSL